jgi:hypothetical protein
MEVIQMASAKNILVGASPLFLSALDSTSANYKDDMEPGSTDGVSFVVKAAGATPPVPATVPYADTLNLPANAAKWRNVGFTNNGLQITYNPSYGSVTVDQLLDSAKLFKESMEVMIATELAEGTLENVLAVFGQAGSAATAGATDAKTSTIGLEAGALGIAPTERQLVAVGQAPTEGVTKAERVYYARRVLSVQQSQFSLSRNAATTFPVTFRLLPVEAKAGKEYGVIVDRVLVA